MPPRAGIVDRSKAGRNRNRSEPHSAFSPDFAPSHFFLFGLLKDRLAGRTIQSTDELIEGRCETTNAILWAKLEKLSSNGISGKVFKAMVIECEKWL
jgi:hypothetical protein